MGYGSESGKCRFNILHSIDLGVRQYLQWVRKHKIMPTRDDRSRQFDSIGYFGYRFDYILGKSLTINQLTMSVHGMVGRVNQHILVLDGDGYRDKDIFRRKFARGAKARIKWFFLDLDAGYFDGKFHMEASFVIPLTKMW